MKTHKTETIACTECGIKQTFDCTGMPLSGLCTICRKKKWRRDNPEEKMPDFFCKGCNSKIGKNSRTLLCRKCYVVENKDKIQLRSSKYYSKRYKEDTSFRIAAQLRTRMRSAIKESIFEGRKVGSAVRDLGCSMEELKRHLESKFQLGMTWDNYGEWHIDHILPLCAFDLSNREQFLIACHYTNLQPLWAKDNLAKISDDIATAYKIREITDKPSLVEV